MVDGERHIKILTCDTVTPGSEKAARNQVVRLVVPTTVRRLTIYTFLHGTVVVSCFANKSNFVI